MNIEDIAQLSSLIELFDDGSRGLVHVFIWAGSGYATLSNFREPVCRDLNQFAVWAGSSWFHSYLSLAISRTFSGYPLMLSLSSSPFRLSSSALLHIRLSFHLLVCFTSLLLSLILYIRLPLDLSNFHSLFRSSSLQNSLPLILLLPFSFNRSHSHLFI